MTGLSSAMAESARKADILRLRGTSTESFVVDLQLAALLDQIVPALKPDAVYLFGSRARGDHEEDSDYDLLVVVPDETPQEQIRLDRTYRFARAAGVPADIIACRKAMFERNRERVGTLSNAVARDGVLIFGRA